MVTAMDPALFQKKLNFLSMFVSVFVYIEIN